MENEYMRFKSLFRPRNKKVQGRKVWGLDLETVWVPVFLASNTIGETNIPSDALGAPLRLATDSDGAVRFTKLGRPIVRVAQPIRDQVAIVRENIEADMMVNVTLVQEQHPDEYKAQVQAAQEAAIPVINRQNDLLVKAAQKEAEKVAVAA